MWFERDGKREKLIVKEIAIVKNAFPYTGTIRLYPKNENILFGN